ncbi:MAG: hypothetical protein KGI29_00950 [Pseudomonadota bacterium]|nr:hypothetical protein [Pseudomonadota bacterium]
MAEPKIWWEGAWDSVKDTLGGGAGAWIIGGLAAAAGLAMGGVSIIGFLLAAALSMLAINFAPQILGAFGIHPKAAASGGRPPVPSRQETPARPLTPEQRLSAEVIELPTDEDRNKAKVKIDGQKYDIVVEYDGNTPGKFKATAVKYKKVEDPDEDRFYRSLTLSPIEIGRLDKEGKAAFDEEAVGKMTGKIAEKMRAEILKQGKAAVVTGLNPLIGKDGNAFIVKGGSGARYVIKTENDGLTINNLDGQVMQNIEVTDPAALQNPSALSRIIVENVAHIGSTEQSVRKTTVGGMPITFPPSGSMIGITTAAIASENKPAGEGSFMLNGQKIEYKLNSSYNEDKGEYTSEGITLIVDGKEVPAYIKSMNLGKAIPGKDGTVTYTPDEKKFEELFKGALKQHEDSIEGLKTHLYEITPAAPAGAAPAAESYLLEAQKSNYVITAKESGGKFKVTVRNLADDQEISVDKEFTGKHEALKAGLHTVVDEFGENGKKGVNVKKRDMINDYASNQSGGNQQLPVYPQTGVAAARGYSGAVV